jgi:hypothetical protein
MGKYMEMSGRFMQDGASTPTNSFCGYVELEDEKYSFYDIELGKVTVQYFCGIQRNAYDPETSRLVKGGLQSDEKAGETMFFKKFVADPKLSTVSYGLAKNPDGTFDGIWVAEPHPFENMNEDAKESFISANEQKAQLTKFNELTAQQVQALGVKEFLVKGYKETSKLPAHAQDVLDVYEEVKQALKTMEEWKSANKLCHFAGKPSPEQLRIPDGNITIDDNLSV